MTMKLKYVGWVALSGLFAVSLAGCAAQSGQTAPAGSEQAVVQTEETQGPAAGQAAVDEQADAEADAATAEQEAANPAELQIVDSGWFVADNGMVDFAVEVQNPSKTLRRLIRSAKSWARTMAATSSSTRPSKLPACCPILPTITPMWPGPPPTPRPLQPRW
ncbi:MAG: hypothetical protein ACLUW6_11945 [Coriobacteriaceae bacterium]